MRLSLSLATLCLACAWGGATASAAEKLKALIVDGQNNHKNWPETTPMMKRYLEETGLFTVDVVTHAPKGEDPNFKPAFKNYTVVVSNFGHGAAPWPAETRAAFEDYVTNGGGFVVIHAADNSFPDWEAYNRMIGLGGWGGRNEKSGPYVYYNADGKLVRDTATHCWLCGEPARPDDPWQADHIYPGKPDSPLAPAHRSCNIRRRFMTG